MKIKAPVVVKQQSSITKHAKVLGFLLLCVLGVFPLMMNRSKASSTTTASASSEKAPLLERVAPMPLERTELLGVDVLMQRPAAQYPPQGIFFVGHGCSHSHTDFWPSTPDVCPECLGLPEDSAIVDMALHEFHFVVVAFSSANRDSKCWAVSEGERVGNVLGKVQELLHSEKKDGPRIPIIAFGASSGGKLVGGTLVEAVERTEAKKLDAFISQISAPEPRTHRRQDQHALPVAVYITMNRDTRTDQQAEEIVASLKEENHFARHFRVDSLPVTESFFSDRITTINLEQSTTMVNALEEATFLDSTTKQLRQDPRQSNWRDVLRPHAGTSDHLVADESPISEVMNVAWGMHEMTRDGVREAIQYIMLKLKEDKGEATQRRLRK